MSRRCKVGKRARIIGTGNNAGLIVLVIRPYFGEEIDGGRWVEKPFPWVVTSLGRPIQPYAAWTKELLPVTMTGVFDDSELEPLDDEDDGLTQSTDKELPIKRPKVKARKVKEAGHA